MSTRIPYIDEYDEDKVFRYTEYALLGLAQFKKKEDIKIIKNQLLSHHYLLSTTSFDLMRQFPDSAYLEVYEAFYPKSFYFSICIERNFYTAIDFINSIATYKDSRTAAILDWIITRKPFAPCLPETDYIKEELMDAVWKNKCDAYKKLRDQIEQSIPESKRNIVALPIDTTDHLSRDTSFQKSHW